MTDIGRGQISIFHILGRGDPMPLNSLVTVWLVNKSFLFMWFLDSDNKDMHNRRGP